VSERPPEPLAADAEALAAIEAALAALLPTAAPASAAASWRFSGRWWTSPLPLRRSRPSR